MAVSVRVVGLALFVGTLAAGLVLYFFGQFGHAGIVMGCGAMPKLQSRYYWRARRQRDRLIRFGAESFSCIGPESFPRQLSEGIAAQKSGFRVAQALPLVACLPHCCPFKSGAPSISGTKGAARRRGPQHRSDL